MCSFIIFRYILKLAFINEEIIENKIIMNNDILKEEMVIKRENNTLEKSKEDDDYIIDMDTYIIIINENQKIK